MAEREARGTRARPEEVAAYLATMAQELKAMAEAQGFDTLGYLLDMARLEAEARAEVASNRFARTGTGNGH